MYFFRFTNCVLSWMKYDVENTITSFSGLVMNIRPLTPNCLSVHYGLQLTVKVSILLFQFYSDLEFICQIVTIFI